MKTGHHAIQLHTYGPKPSTCIHLYACMPNGSVLSVPGVCLPSGCIRVCLCLPTCQVRPLWERVAGHGGYRSCWLIRRLRLRLPTVYQPIYSVTRTPRAVRLNMAPCNTATNIFFFFQPLQRRVLVGSLRWQMAFLLIQERLTEVLRWCSHY